jgi:hypothetical protein
LIAVILSEAKNPSTNQGILRYGGSVVKIFDFGNDTHVIAAQEVERSED